MKSNNINLSHGAGGAESYDLIKIIKSNINIKTSWQNLMADAATLDISKLPKFDNLVFATDSYTINPIFFSGGDIGKLSICGTINDLAVMGGRPIALSLSFIIEEGFLISDFKKILKSIQEISEKTQIPIVTGDTKVMHKGDIDQIVINTSGIGITNNIIKGQKINIGDKVIASGSIGDHGATILANRFNYKTSLQSDCQSILSEISQVYDYIKLSKDPTRGGLASILNEISIEYSCKITLDKDAFVFLKETKTICKLLGISPYELASEGRFICIASPENAKKVTDILKNSRIIGEISDGEGVDIKNSIGGNKKLLFPKGRIVPRIC